VADVLTQAQYRQPACTPRPGPIDDLIRRHHELLRAIYERHRIELGLQDVQARAGHAA
jgi:hypothetical protein